MVIQTVLCPFKDQFQQICDDWWGFIIEIGLSADIFELWLLHDQCFRGMYCLEMMAECLARAMK